MEEKTEQRVFVKSCLKTGKSPSETYELLKTAFGDKCMSRSIFFIWFNRFKDGRESVEDYARLGWPFTAKPKENAGKLIELVRSGRQPAIREMVNELNLSKNIRKKWSTLAKRDTPSSMTQTSTNFCKDHFEVSSDTLLEITISVIDLLIKFST